MIESEHFAGMVVLWDGNVKESFELHVSRGNGGGVIHFLELIPELLGSGAHDEACLEATVDLETHGPKGLVIEVVPVIHLLGHIDNDLYPILVIDVVGVIEANGSPALGLMGMAGMGTVCGKQTCGYTEHHNHSVTVFHRLDF